jgi:D-alanine-D-alanine ligase
VVAVLHGGRSCEREVSLSSGREVLTALATPVGPEDRRGPRRVLPVEIDAEGRWVVEGRRLAPGEALAALAEVDVFFSVLHGGEGEDGTLQGLLAASDRTFTGSGVSGCAVAMDKVVGRELLRAAGARVAPGRTLDEAGWAASSDRVLAELATWDGPGWVVKPRGGGSSVGVSVVRRTELLAEALATAFSWEQEVLVEALVEGLEVTGGVLQTPDRGLTALPVVEIHPHEGRFFDYEEKYTEGGATEVCPPRELAPAVAARVEELSLLAHRTLHCDGYSRSDFIVPRDGGEPVFLELNTLPGLTPRSLVPLAAAADGVDYRTLCLWITAAALEGAPPRSG